MSFVTFIVLCFAYLFGPLYFFALAGILFLTAVSIAAVRDGRKK